MDHTLWTGIAPVAVWAVLMLAISLVSVEEPDGDESSDEGE